MLKIMSSLLGHWWSLQATSLTPRFSAVAAKLRLLVVNMPRFLVWSMSHVVKATLPHSATTHVDSIIFDLRVRYQLPAFETMSIGPIRSSVSA